MKSEAIDLTGQTFGRLFVTGRAPRRERFEKRAVWSCRCECGVTTEVPGKSLRRGATKSCGCYKRDIASKRHRTHGMSKRREYIAWCAAKTRCYNPSQAGWIHYGGRGVTMCDRWLNDFPAFLSDMGPCPPGRSLDRIDTNGPYSPDNCRWATRVQQQNNTTVNRRIVHDGQERTLSDWARSVGLDRSVLKQRLRRGWSVADTLTRPLLTSHGLPR